MDTSLRHGTRLVSCGIAAALAFLAAAPPAAADPLPAVALERIADGLTAPIEIADPDDGSGRLFIVEQSGTIRILTAGGTLLPEPWLDLRPNMVALIEGFDERGLLGFALHPEFATNGRFFVTYTAALAPTAPPGWSHTRRVSEFTAGPATPDRVEIASERVVLALDWPSRKHNGGGLAFGPDGYLYVGLGDAGGVHGLGTDVLHEAFDVPAHLRHWDATAQDTTSLYGKILRLDVDRGLPGYAVPASNPLRADQGRGEIYAWGFRNPYRIAFDPAGHEGAFVSAVGETLWEAVYLVDRPGNYGWAVREGRHCFDRANPLNPPAECATRDALGYAFSDPIVEYPNRAVEQPGVAEGVPREGLGTASIGGRIYRGEAIEGLDGALVIADWSRAFDVPSGQIFIARPSPGFGAPWTLEKLAEVDDRVTALGQDARGEIYVLTNETYGPYGTTGEVHRLVPGTTP